MSNIDSTNHWNTHTEAYMPRALVNSYTSLPALAARGRLDIILRLEDERDLSIHAEVLKAHSGVLRDVHGGRKLSGHTLHLRVKAVP